MIPGVGANGQYPNLSAGMPVSTAARSATIKIQSKHAARVVVQARKALKLAKYPTR